MSNNFTSDFDIKLGTTNPAHIFSFTHTEINYLFDRKLDKLHPPNDWPPEFKVTGRGLSVQEYIKAGRFDLFVESLKNRNESKRKWHKSIRESFGI